MAVYSFDPQDTFEEQLEKVNETVKAVAMTQCGEPIVIVANGTAMVGWLLNADWTPPFEGGSTTMLIENMPHGEVRKVAEEHLDKAVAEWWMEDRT